MKYEVGDYLIGTTIPTGKSIIKVINVPSIFTGMYQIKFIKENFIIHINKDWVEKNFTLLPESVKVLYEGKE